MNQTPIPEGSQPLVIKPFPVSAVVLKLDHSTSSEYLLTILHFFFQGLSDAPLFSLLFSPMGGDTFLVSWLWCFLPICFYVGVHGITLNYLCQCFAMVFWVFYTAILGFWIILFSLFPPLSYFHLSVWSPCPYLKKWLFSHILSSVSCFVSLYILSWTISLPLLLSPPSSSSFWNQYE